MLRNTCMLAFAEVVEYLYTSIAESLDIYIVERLFLLLNVCVYSINYEMFSKQKHHVNSSRYCKHWVEIKWLAHCENHCIIYS